MVGRIELIVGPMFASKTDTLINRVERARYAKQRVQAFKPTTDTRSPLIRSHSGRSLEATPITSARYLTKLLNARMKLVAIDEGQMFGLDLIPVVLELSNQGIAVVVAGLALTWKGEPWEPIPSLMAVADHITQLYAVCVLCGADASRTQRISGGEEVLQVGGKESYEARCRSCFDPNPSMPDRLPPAM